MSIDVKYMRSTYESESWSTLPGKSPSTFKGAVTSQETTGHYTSYTVDNVVKVKTVSDRVREESTSHLSKRASNFNTLSLSLISVIVLTGTLAVVALGTLAFASAAVLTGIALAALGLMLYSNKQRDRYDEELKKWDQSSLLPAMKRALVDLNNENLKMYRDLNSELFSILVKMKKLEVESEALIARCDERIRQIDTFQNAFNSNLQNNMNHRFV